MQKKQLSLFLIVIIIGSLVPGGLAEEEISQLEESAQNFHFLQYIQDSIRMDAIKNIINQLYPSYAEEERILKAATEESRKVVQQIDSPAEQGEKVVLEAMNILQEMATRLNRASPPPTRKLNAGFLGGFIGGLFSGYGGTQTSGFQTGNPTPGQEAIGATYGALQGVLGANLGDSTGAQATQLQTVNGIQLTVPVTANPNVILTTPVSTLSVVPPPVGGFTILTVKPTGNQNDGLIGQTIVSAQGTGVASVAGVLGGRTSASSIAKSVGNVLDFTVGQVIAGGNTGSVGQSIGTNQNTIAISIAGLLAGAKTGSSSSAGSVAEVIGNNAVQSVGHVISGPTGTLARTIGGLFSSLAHTIVGQGGSIARIIAGNFQLIAGPPAPHHAPVAVVTGVQREISYGYEPQQNALDYHLKQAYSQPAFVQQQQQTDVQPTVVRAQYDN
ncbi:cAMP-inducible prespore protein [Heterostelium album PN500]|uniref:cAMP-inducible prespore protein n=1 Tax=Heterostelium pallidum (strain ATCC 26659 / Pp 5 / PN500) TaxID=670386 RepID=D3BTT1_HETP5|nr:cAMP-inducible prespore protein [Heterostelium album PN500]EFA75117.1 cAMP-inducible prespore protein [Heterostelium album PN500]|eukprot:XP_020427251.1 cAMP-inducible prespore protein [Heterostelium album PN500]